MHILNSLLPGIESQQIEANERDSRLAILSSMHRIRSGLKGPDATTLGVLDAGPEWRAHVSNADMGRLFRQVHTHSTLKYDFATDLIDETLSLLYEVYLVKGLLSVPMKIKALRLMKTLCEKGKHLNIRFQFSWRTMWAEITLISSRGEL